MNHAQKLIEATEQYTLRPRKGGRTRLIAAAIQYLIDNVGAIVNDTWYVETSDIEEIIQQLKELENEELDIEKHILRLKETQ